MRFQAKAIGRMRVQDASCRQQAEATGDSSRIFTTATLIAGQLDVRVPDARQLNLQGLYIGRGSEGPRALAVYYYSFLHTAKNHGSSAFCPIVVDAPNQQGQDKDHLRRIMQLLLNEAPSHAQVIIASETAPPSTVDTVILDVSWKKDQVLRDDKYEEVLDYVNPFLAQSAL
jgi:hypothetical protein